MKFNCPPNGSAARNVGEHPNSIALPSEVAASTSRPDFFRLPDAKSCRGDPHFGFRRTYYYEGEKRGWWRLVRIRERGKLRGVTLVPYDAVAAFIRSQVGGETEL
jgi:hypothetical protein